MHKIKLSFPNMLLNKPLKPADQAQKQTKPCPMHTLHTTSKLICNKSKKKKKFLEKEERVTCLRNIGESSSLANCIFYSNRGFARCSCWSWSKSRYGLALSRHECSISESKSRTATRPFAGLSSSLRFGREPKTLAQRQPWSSRLHVILILMCWVLSLPYLCVLVSLLLLTSQQGK